MMPGEGPGQHVSERVENFLGRWGARDGGQERANYGMFLTELCDLARAASIPMSPLMRPPTNNYVFERVVK